MNLKDHFELRPGQDGVAAAIPAGAAQKDAFDVELSTLSRSLRK